MPVPSDAQLEEAATTVAAYSLAMQTSEARAHESIVSIWAGFEDWYDDAQVARRARSAAGASRAGQTILGSTTREYVAAMLRPLGIRVRRSNRLRVPDLRGGADLVAVHSRPAAVWRREYGLTGDEVAADRAAQLREDQLIQTDLLLTRRAVAQAEMDDAGVKLMRRLLRPELSKSGSCGLCIVASTRTYKVTELMPIHAPSCQCLPYAVVAGVDVAQQLNDADLAELYAAAGGTGGDKLRRVRVKTIQHGELGPTLVDGRHAARDEKRVQLEDDPERADAMLDRLRQVLEQLLARQAAGEDVDAPLRYQRGLIDRLESIAA